MFATFIIFVTSTGKMQTVPLKQRDSEGDREQVKEAVFQTLAFNSRTLPPLRSAE